MTSARLLLCLLICAKARRPRNRADRLLNSVLQQIKSSCSALQCCHVCSTNMFAAEEQTLVGAQQGPL